MWRLATIQPMTQFNPIASTQVVRLPVTQFLKQLFLVVEGVNGATTGDVAVFRDISSIQIIGDGSKEIFNVSGTELLLSEIYNGTHLPQMTTSLGGGALQRVVFPIRFYFDRHDDDVTFLDTTRYVDLQLRVTSTATSGASNKQSVSLGVWALVEPWNNNRSNLGYRRLVAIDRYTSTASGDRLTFFPIRYWLYNIHLMTTTKNTLVSTPVSYVRLDLDDNATILLDSAVSPLRSLTKTFHQQLDVATDIPGSDSTLVDQNLLTAGDDLIIDTHGWYNHYNSLVTTEYTRIRLTQTNAAANYAMSVIAEEYVRLG